MTYIEGQRDEYSEQLDDLHVRHGNTGAPIWDLIEIDHADALDDERQDGPTCLYVYDLPDGACDNDAIPGSAFCAPHTDQARRDREISDDMDRCVEADSDLYA